MLYIYMRKSVPKKGLFIPTNPKKYKGNSQQIVYRSMLEKRVMTWLDENSSVLEWQSEEFYIPYYDPTVGHMRRYFPDIWMRARTPDGGEKTILIEIKPKSQTKPPKQTKRKSKNYLMEVVNWGVNNAKWEAAKKYCDHRGWEFKLVTEEDMGLSYK